MHVGLIGAGNVARALARGCGEPMLVPEGGSGRTSALAEETRDHDTRAVLRRVTPPGGTTARGLAALERGGARPRFQGAFAVVEWGR